MNKLDNTAEKNIVDLNKQRSIKKLKQLKENEDKIIEQIKNDKNKVNKFQGFKNPLEDEVLSKGLKDVRLGKIIRSFILDFKKIKPSEINRDNQPRDQIADKDYCEKDLLPRIEKNGLEYLPFVNEEGALGTGFNRTYCLEIKYPGEEIPVLVISKPYFIDEDGCLKEYDEKTEKYLARRSTSRTNPAHKHQPMSMASVASEIEALFDIDPKFMGLNPSGEKFKNSKCEAFNSVMDVEFPGYYTSPSARGKVFKMLWNKTTGKKAKIEPLSDHVKTGLLTSIGWNTGWHDGRRKNFGEHICENSKAYIGMTNTNGNNFEGIVVNRVIEMFCSGKFGSEDVNSEIKSINVFCEVYKPEKDILLLNNQRDNFLKKVLKYNKKAKLLWTGEDKENIKDEKMPYVEKVYFPKQLNTPSDQGQMWVFDEKNNKFVKEDKK